MRTPKQLKWIIAFIVLLSTVGMVQITLNDVIYLPFVVSQATQTPTLTPSPTSTPTPTPTVTPTPTPNNVMLVEVVNSVTENPLDEYVRIYNYKSSSVNLTGWFIRDDGPHRFDFPADFYVGRNQTVRIWTKAGVNTSTDLYWGSESEVWNDYGDCAYLRDYSGEEKLLIDIYCYSRNENGVLEVISDPKNVVP